MSSLQVRIAEREWSSYALMADLLESLKTKTKSAARYTAISDILTNSETIGGMDLLDVLMVSVVRTVEHVEVTRKNPSLSQLGCFSLTMPSDPAIIPTLVPYNPHGIGRLGAVKKYSGDVLAQADGCGGGCDGLSSGTQTDRALILLTGSV